LSDTPVVMSLGEMGVPHIWTVGIGSRVLGTAAALVVLYLGFTFVAHDASGDVLYPWKATFDFGSGGENLVLAVPLMLVGVGALVVLWHASIRLAGDRLEITNFALRREIPPGDVTSVDLDYWGLRIGYRRQGVDRRAIAVAGMSVVNVRLFSGRSRTREIADEVAGLLEERGLTVEAKFRGAHEGGR